MQIFMSADYEIVDNRDSNKAATIKFTKNTQTYIDSLIGADAKEMAYDECDDVEMYCEDLQNNYEYKLLLVFFNKMKEAKANYCEFNSSDGT